MKNLAITPKGDEYRFGQRIAQIKNLLDGELQQLSFPPCEGALAHAFACDYLLYNLDRKSERKIYSSAPTSRLQNDLRLNIAKTEEIARRDFTLQGFLEREQINATINESGINVHPDLYTTKLLYSARRIIRDIVGGAPHVPRILSRGAFGNGASATLKRSEADRSLKWTTKPSTTRKTFELMRNFISASPTWYDVLSDGDPVWYFDSRGNRVIPDTAVTFRSSAVLDMVPKTQKVLRIIIKEPELNGFVQKGIGSELRSKLRRNTGIDLNSSGIRNSELARQASIDGLHATVDAERASDSLTTSLYELLFPRKWYELFMSARSPYVSYTDSMGQHIEHQLSMMSGMGNGFTFEAESIIFYALGEAARRHHQADGVVSIHGDDLILPTAAYATLVDLYTVCGITVNMEKSFSSGPFRESCGGHFFNGENVKPFFVTGETGTSLGDWFWLRNSLLLWANQRNLGIFDTTPWSSLIMELESDISSLLSAAGLAPRDCKVGKWLIPPSWSRREGFFSDSYPLKGRQTSWKMHVNKTISNPACFSVLGSYMQKLAQPTPLTPLDLIHGRKPSGESPWERDIDSYEATGYRRTTRWPSFTDCGERMPLWFVHDRMR